MFYSFNNLNSQNSAFILICYRTSGKNFSYNNSCTYFYLLKTVLIVLRFIGNYNVAVILYNLIKFKITSTNDYFKISCKYLQKTQENIK